MQSSTHILVAEDDTFSQMAVKMILGSLKLAFTIAENGKIAYETYANKKGQINLIFMDLHMPEMDGFEAAKKIRSFEKSNGITPVRIIALSADDDDDTKKKVAQSGMNGMVKKPLKKEVVTKLVPT